MKYTKKYQLGGKTPKEIMEEARRNQALELDAQARESRPALNISRYISPEVTVDMPAQKELELKNFNVPFGQAFANARKAGLKEFEWFNPKNNRLEKFTTALASNNAETAKKPEVQVKAESVKNVDTSTPSEVTSPVISSTTSLPRNNIIATQHITRPDTSGIPTSARTSSSINRGFWDRGIFGGTVDWLRKIDQRNRASQQANYSRSPERSPLFQQGGTIQRSGWDRFFRRTPAYTPINETESTTRFIDSPLIGRTKEHRVIKRTTPTGDQFSQMTITNPGTNRADTIFTPPGNRANPDLYPKFTPRDIRLQNKKGVGKESYMQKFTSPNYFSGLKAFQQGGKVEETNQEQLILDFAIRYLKGLGVEESVLQNGIPEENIEDVTNAINEVDTPEFWLAYEEDPDAAMQDYLASREDFSEEAIEFAKKGAKLKALKKLNRNKKIK